MGVLCACHRNGVLNVRQVIVRFVLYGLASFFFIETQSKATALNHKAIDHSMEYGIGVKAVACIL